MAQKQTPCLHAQGLHAPENRSHHLLVGTDFLSLRVSNKVVQAGDVVVLDEGNPHIRHSRCHDNQAGRELWCLLIGGPRLAGTVSGICAISKLVRRVKMCRKRSKTESC